MSMLSEGVRSIDKEHIAKVLRMEAGEEKFVDILNRLGIDAYCQLVSDGATTTKIAATIGCSYKTVSRWAVKQKGYDEKIAAAREAAADMFVTLANETVQHMMMDRDAIAMASAQKTHYMKMASYFDPERYGEVKNAPEDTGRIVFNVNFGDGVDLTSLPADNLIIEHQD